jgi:ribose/xylose/arabinose/galactoside ABC-type transport system permease subunit
MAFAMASFGFAKSHAAAFARTAYESSFLKLFYPAQFVVGLINGLGVAYAGVPPIIMTLGMNSAIQGLLLVYTHGGFASAPPHGLVNFVNGNTISLSTDLLIWLVVIVVAACSSKRWPIASAPSSPQR